MTTTMTTTMTTIRLFAFAAVSLAARGAGSQTPDPRWTPLLGCWEPNQTVAPAATNPAIATQTGQADRRTAMCVAPIAGGVEIATLTNGAVVASDTLIADAEHRAVARQGCAGWQRSEWSSDG